MYPAIASLYWTKLAETAWYAGETIGYRLYALSAQQMKQAEWELMHTEKAEVFAVSAFRMAMAIQQEQLRWMSLMMQGKLTHNTRWNSDRIYSAGLAPYHRKTRANARRLRKG